MNDIVVRIRCKKRNTTDEEDDAADEIVRLTNELEKMNQWKKNVEQAAENLLYQISLCDRGSFVEYDEERVMCDGGWIELVSCANELKESLL